MEIVQDAAAAAHTSPVSSAPAVKLLPGAVQLMPVPHICSQRSHGTMDAIGSDSTGTRPSSAPCRGTAEQSAKSLSSVFAQYTSAATAHLSTAVSPPQTLVTSRSSSSACNSMTVRQVAQRPVAEYLQRSRAALPVTSTAQPVPCPVLQVPIGQQHAHNAVMRAWHNRVNSSVSFNQQPNRGSSNWCRHGSGCCQNRCQQLQQLAHGQSADLCLSSSRLQQQLSRLQRGMNAASSTDWPVTSCLRGSSLATSAAPLGSHASSSHLIEERATGGNHTTQAHMDYPLPRGNSQSLTARAEVHHGLADNDESGQRMIGRWQAHRMSTAGMPLRNEVLLDEDTQLAYAIWASTSGSSNTGSLVAASRNTDTLGSTAPGSASHVLAVLAAQLLDHCTVQSSKKQLENCCICLDDIRVNELAPLLMCGHRMHRGCLIRWLSQRLAGHTQEQQAVVCPLCKQVSVDRAVLCRV